MIVQRANSSRLGHSYAKCILFISVPISIDMKAYYSKLSTTIKKGQKLHRVPNDCTLVGPFRVSGGPLDECSDWAIAFRVAAIVLITDNNHDKPVVMASTIGLFEITGPAQVESGPEAVYL